MRRIFSWTRVIAEYVDGTAVGSLTREYIYSGSNLLATIEGGTTKYHHQDHLSVRVNTDSAGTVIGQQGNCPYGEAWYSTSATKWRFTSYERDPESTLDYAMFRYDNSRLGRFMQTDPIAGSVSDPQSLNLYAYTRNDPLNLVDPLGLLIQVCSRIEGGQRNCTWTFESWYEYFWYRWGWNRSGGGRPERRLPTDPDSGGGGPGGIGEILENLPRALTCAATLPMQWLASAGHQTIGIGFGGSAGVGFISGVAVTGGVAAVANPQGQVGLSLTGGGNPGFGVYGAGATGGYQVTRSSAQNFDQFSGRADGFGVSGGPYAFEMAFGNATTSTLTVGGGVGGKIASAQTTYTTVPIVVDCN
ncbi:MAG: RHS repeat-associated core domain-containing protein [Acidobacteria bacterium]|nr:RHS repeat-associated core domain-containing protein [Acidobacteriota bacterium]